MLTRFVFGLLIGSFLNVLGTRYNEDEFLFSKRVLGGRSHCPHCGKTLRWFELVPIISFIAQGTKCRSCKQKISFQYPAIEILSGLILAFIPVIVGTNVLTAAFWVTVFLILLLITIIDLRLSIIPNELNVILLVMGIFLLFSNIPSDFSGPYSILFGFESDPVLNHIFSSLVLGIFFGLIIFITRGKGMGMGDLKLVIPLGLIFGWPGGIIFVVLSFLIGAIAGIILIALKKRTRRQHIPFGPFLAAGAMTYFFFGENILRFYFEVLANIAFKLFGA